MNNILFYGKNKITGDIELLKSHNNILFTNEREYLTLNIYGKLNENVFFQTTNNRKILICTDTYWLSTPTSVPNPNTNTEGSINKSDNLSFDSSLGIIQGLNINKKYLVNVRLNFSSFDLSGNIDFGLKINSTDSNYNNNLNDNFGNPLNPICNCIASQYLDYAGTGLSLSTMITNITSFTILLYTLNSIEYTVDNNWYNTNISITLLEI